jgi:beta-lactamase class A
MESTLNTKPFVRSIVTFALCASLFATSPVPASAFSLTSDPIEELQAQLSSAVMHAPGRVGIAIEDLATGETSGVNANANLPAASVIKIPVMVEVFKQMEAGALDLNTTVDLVASDRDWGWGDMADAPIGTERTVNQLLWLMITQSDNTATNMLIRTVGRVHINHTMAALGMRQTRLSDYIRSESDSIRYALRTSPKDMLSLLDKIARERLVDEWSSREMLAILAGQHHNGLIPAVLPAGLKIAHKTGSLHDTLNDVGIVYRDNEPYVIAVMTTQLSDLDLGRAFIHRVSRLAYHEFGSVERWRENRGIAAFRVDGPSASIAGAQAPDDAMWDPLAPKPSPEAPELSLPTDPAAESEQ